MAFGTIYSKTFGKKIVFLTFPMALKLILTDHWVRDLHLRHIALNE